MSARGTLVFVFFVRVIGDYFKNILVNIEWTLLWLDVE